MTWPEVASQFLEIVHPAATLVTVGVTIWVYGLVTGETIPKVIKGILSEIRKLLTGERSLRSLNAIIVLLAFILVTIFLGSSLRNEIIPELGENAARADLAMYGLSSGLIVFFFATALISVRLCKHDER